jgi:ligand-binding sensor domain-containing protein
LYRYLFIIPGAFIFLLSGKLKAQESGALLDHITSQHGLSHDKVRSIIQDRRGFIWIATWHGLNRYDGHRFKTFYHNPADSFTLPDNRIQKLYEDKNGDLWICSWTGVSRYDPVTEKFENFLSYSDKRPLPVTCYDIVEYKNGYWVATNKGIYRVNLEEKRLNAFTGKGKDDPINSVVCFSLFPSARGYLLGATFKGILKMQPENNSYEIIRLIDGNIAHEIPDNQSSKIIEENDSTWWIGSWSGGLKNYNPLTKRFVSFFHENQPAYTFFYNIVRQIVPSRQSDRYFWIAGSGNGFRRFDKQTGKFETYYPPDADNLGPDPGPVFVIYEDRQNRIWMGNDAGIYVLDPARQFIRQKKVSWINKTGCDKDIIEIYEDPIDTTHNTYWICTWTCGVYLSDSLFSKPKSTPASQLVSSLSLKHSFTPTALLRDMNGNLWITAGLKGLLLISHDGKIKKYWGNSIPSVKGNPIFEGIYFRESIQDNNGKIWITTAKGLYYYEPATDNLEEFEDEALQGKSIHHFREDSSGYWVALFCTDNNQPLLYRIYKSDGKAIPVQGEALKYISCSGQKSINAFLADKAGHLWIGTSYGLIHGVLRGEQFITKLYTEADGLPPVVIGAMAEKDERYLWLGNSLGVALFDRIQRKVIRSLSISDGLLISDITYMYADNKDRLFIRENEGKYNLITGDILASPRVAPPVVMTSIKIFNQPYLHPERAIADLEKLTFDHTQNNFQFDFAALDFTNPDRQQFAYKLEGLDEDWILSDHPTAVYNNLQPGTYTLKVKAANSFSVWNEKGISLQLIIAPPFWQTIWFYIILAVLSCLLIYWFVRRRITTIRKQEQLKQLKTEAEMKALRTQMNPHFIFNCLNTIDAYILKNKQEEASDILQKFSQLIRLVLENSRHDLVPVEEEIKALELYIELEQYILDDSFSSRITVHPSLLENPYLIPPMLLQPYVENSILHGLRYKKNNEGHLQITLRLVGNLIECIIEDNGIGRKRSMAINESNPLKKESLGMRVTSDRIDNLNEIWQQPISVRITDIENEQQTGTRVEIDIPVRLSMKNKV